MMFSTTITCILLFAHLDTAHCETYEEFVHRTLQQMCPYDTFCSQNASKTLANSKRRSCCLPCSCDTTCITRNNCCPDYIHPSRNDTDDHTPRKETCLPAALFKGIERSMFDGEYRGVHFYHTVDSCPALYPDETMVTKCTAPIPEDFIGAVRVSDATGQVYTNRYCAICHGVTDYKTWELRIRLQSKGAYGYDITKFNISSLLDKNAVIFSLPPQDHMSVISRCYRPNIVACNQTGLWGIFNSYLHKACNSYTNNYIERIRTIKQMFKNPFCYLCNKGQNDVISDSCEPDGTRKSNVGEFSAIIDINSVPTVQTTHWKHACKQDEILDPYFAVCKPLFCPIGTRPSYGRCVSLYKMSTGLAIRFPIAFNVTINGGAESADRPLQIQTREHAEAIDKIIIQKFDMSVKKCRLCFSSIYQFDDHQIFGTPLLLIAEFITTSRCTTGDMFDAVVNNMDGQPFLASLDNMNITVTAALHYGLPIEFYDVLMSTRHGSNTFNTGLDCIGGLLIRLPKFHCPNLGLTYIEYQQVISGIVSGSPAIYEDFMVDDIPDGQGGNGSMYKICVKDYLHQEKSSSGKIPIGRLEMSVLVMLYRIIA